MICRLTDGERTKARWTLYKDDVFVIAHSVIGKFRCSLALEEIFCTAEKLADHLLAGQITYKDFIDLEIDDFEARCDDKEAVFPILVITFVKLCALRQRYPLAGEIARLMVHRPQRYDGFDDILRELSNREIEVLKNRRIDLLSYELKTVIRENPDAGIISRYVNAVLECSIEVIEKVMNAFAVFNDEQNHKFDMQLHALTQGYKDKQEGKTVTKIDVHIDSIEMSDSISKTENIHNYASGSTHSDNSRYLSVNESGQSANGLIKQL